MKRDKEGGTRMGLMQQDVWVLTDPFPSFFYPLLAYTLWLNCQRFFCTVHNIHREQSKSSKTNSKSIGEMARRLYVVEWLAGWLCFAWSLQEKKQEREWREFKNTHNNYNVQYNNDTSMSPVPWCSWILTCRLQKREKERDSYKGGWDMGAISILSRNGPLR